MREQVERLIRSLLELLLGWAVPMIVAFMGCGLYALSSKFSGTLQMALQGTAWACWLNAPIYNLRGYAATVFLANQEANYAPTLEHFKRVVPVIDDVQQYASEVDSVAATIKGMDAAAVEYIAHGIMAGRPFTERAFTGKGRLTPRVFDNIRGQLISKAYLIPGKGRRRGRWSREGLEFLRDVHYGRILRDLTPPPPPPSVKIPLLHS